MKTKDITKSKLFIGIDVHKRSWIIHIATDLRRFKNFKQLASYVGLISSVHQSGDNLTTTGLTTRAN